jgi:hypothetical protein
MPIIHVTKWGQPLKVASTITINEKWPSQSRLYNNNKCKIAIQSHMCGDVKPPRGGGPLKVVS